MKHEIEMIQQEARQRMAAQTRRIATRSLEHTLVRKASGVTSAALFGTLNRMNVPHTIGGFPWKLGIIGLAQLAEGLSKGAVQAAAAGVADATTAIYVERSISNDTLVSGSGGAF